MNRRAVFLDRDGTINVDKNHLFRFEDWKFMNGAVEAMKGFQKLGFLIIVVTNQAGIAKGLYNIGDVNRLHDKVNLLLREQECGIDAFYICPHYPDITGECNCRKPAPGLILKAASDFGINLAESYMIGDKPSDAIAGISAGVPSFLIKTGHGSQTILGNDSITVVDNIFSAYLLIKDKMQRKQSEGKGLN